MSISEAKVDSYLREVQALWSTAVSERQKYDNLVHRKSKPLLNPKLGTEVDDFRTADLEDCEHDVIDILTMSPTRFGGAPLDVSTDVQQDVKDAVLWAARTWDIENQGRWIDRAYAAGAARYGWKWIRMLCHDEPESTSESLAELKEEYKSRPHPWYFESMADLACGTIMRSNQVQAVLYDFEIPYLAAKEEYASEGNLHIANDGTLGWLGEDAKVDTTTDITSKVRVTICEYRDWDNLCPVCADHHPLWSGVEIVRNSTNSKPSSGLKVNEYTLPYRHAGTLRLIAGRTNDLDKGDPHFYFRPLLFRLYVEATVMNWAKATLHTLANRDSSTERVYLDASTIPSEAIPRLPDEFWSSPVMKTPEVDSGEITVTNGKLYQWPVQASQMLLKVYDEAKEAFERAKPNRWLLGENFTEAAQGTGTANVIGAEQAHLPFDWPLSQMDDFIIKAKEDQWHAIRYWDHESPKGAETCYYATLTGNERVRGMRADSNKRVYVNSTKLSHDVGLYVETSKDTPQGKDKKRSAALQGKQAGIYTSQQVLRLWDFDDVEGQMILLEQERAYEMMRPKQDQVFLNTIDVILAELWDVDPSLLTPMPVVSPPEPVSPPGRPRQSPTPNVNPPAITQPTGGAMPGGGF
jgi:hypothetical protein